MFRCDFYNKVNWVKYIVTQLCQDVATKRWTLKLYYDDACSSNNCTPYIALIMVALFAQRFTGNCLGNLFQNK